MHIKDILLATKGTIINETKDETYNKIKINSKEVKKDDIFVAIIGEKKDGHNYINEAIKNGAKLIITSKPQNKNIPEILVQDTTKALGDIAHYMIKKYHPKVIAITGSVGKTTNSNLLYNMLKTKYKVLTNKKNYNNNIGVPLTVFNLKKDTEILILELGMNHLSEISYLSKMINPETSVITNIGSSHIGNLESKENILKSKLEILDGMKDQKLFVNGDDELLKKIPYAIKSSFIKGDLTGYDVKTTLYKSSFKIKIENIEYKIEIKLPKHILNNVLLSINVALNYNIDIKDIIKTLKEYKTVDKRMDIIKDKNNNIIINDCYNSSFESLTGVLESIQKENGKKLLILGSIKELGKYTKEIHQNIKPYLDTIKNKEIILIGEEMKYINIDAKYFNNYTETIKYLKTKKIKNTLILIKGSRAMKLENITNYFIKKQ